jgi:hypothetical protein
MIYCKIMLPLQGGDGNLEILNEEINIVLFPSLEEQLTQTIIFSELGRLPAGRQG